jgi:hypothetical protein
MTFRSLIDLKVAFEHPHLPINPNVAGSVFEDHALSRREVDLNDLHPWRNCSILNE